jgi:holo-[acyl-carrier protein] synthase
MMGIRTGIDSVSVADVDAALVAHGDRYLTRVYAPAEVAACRRGDGSPDPERLAARWAAKEAAVKLLGAPEGSFAWTDIRVVDAAGRPALEWTERVRTLAFKAGITDVDVSLTHERGTATAVVVALTSS